MKNARVLRMAAHAALFVSLGVGAAAPASANTTGRIGVSGKNEGFFCNNCHAGSAAPTVAFDGPTVMAPGTTATFSFTVTSHAASQVAAGLGVAASGGALGLVEGQGTRLERSEVTQSGPKANDASGRAVFEFTWQAPASDGLYRLFGAGTAVNGNHQQNGDGAARTTYEIVVGAAVPTPTPTPTTHPCVGDCGGDGEVTVNELITGVSMALGVTPLSTCPEFDANADGEVTINEILQAVNSALNGCPVM